MQVLRYHVSVGMRESKSVSWQGYRGSMGVGVHSTPVRSRGHEGAIAPVVLVPLLDHYIAVLAHTSINFAQGSPLRHLHLQTLPVSRQLAQVLAS